MARMGLLGRLGKMMGSGDVIDATLLNLKLQLPQATSTGLVDIIASDWEDTRSDVINIPTHDGVDDSGDQVISEIPAYVPCLELGRVVFNYLSATEDYSGWTTNGSATIDSTSASDKDGGTSAMTASFAATGLGNRVQHPDTLTDYGTDGVVSLWMKGDVGGESISVSDGWSNQGPVTLTTSWKRYSFSFSLNANSFRLMIFASAGTPTISVFAHQMEDVTGLTIQTPSAYQSVGVVIDGTDELVTDGGMEESDTWTDYNTPSTNERSTEQVDAGTYSRKIIGNNTDGFRHVTSFNVVGGVNYFVTARVYVTSGNVRAKNWSGKLPSYDLQNSGTGAWETISGVFEATATGSEGIRFECYSGGATFYVDSVSIKKASTGFAYNVRENAITVTSNVVDESVLGDLISPAPYWAHYPAATNLQRDSISIGDTSNGEWSGTTETSGGPVTVTLDNALSPKGTMKATYVDANGATYPRIVAVNAYALTTEDLTVSVFAKKAKAGDVFSLRIFSGGEISKTVFDLDDGSVVSSTSDSETYTALANNWGFYTSTILAPGAGNYTLQMIPGSYTGSAENDEVYLWGAQGELTAFATPHIETVLSQENRTTCLMRYPYSTSVFNQTEGTVVFKWTPVTTVYTTNEGLVSIEDGIFNIAYAHTAGGGSNVRSYDATTTCTPASAIVWDGLDAIYVAIRWESITSKFQIGYRNITDAGSWVWATESAYDGAFASDSWLNLFYSNNYPHQMNDLRIYSVDKGVDFVEANF